jgi:hypothetical protein
MQLSSELTAADERKGNYKAINAQCAFSWSFQEGQTRVWEGYSEHLLSLFSSPHRARQGLNFWAKKTSRKF